MFREDGTKQIKNIIKPNKLLGQHFLRDKNVLDKIIEAANLNKNDVILEVGPGLGVLTRELAKYAGQVVAVEKDKTLAELLTRQLADEKIDNVEIVADDILSFIKNPPQPSLKGGSKISSPPLGGVRGDSKNTVKILPNPPFTKEGKMRYKVVANIPYYLTSHLIRLLLESPNPPQDIILLIQKEVAKRVCARPPRMSLLAVSVQFYAQPKIIASVSRQSFRPEPKVDSAIIRITPYPKIKNSRHSKRSEESRGIRQLAEIRATKPLDSSPAVQNDKIDKERFFRVLHAGFSHPRKQLMGNLSQELQIAKEKVETALNKAEIKNSQRAETLTVKDWLKLTQSLSLES